MHLVMYIIIIFTSVYEIHMTVSIDHPVGNTNGWHYSHKIFKLIGLPSHHEALWDLLFSILNNVIKKIPHSGEYSPLKECRFANK